MAITIQISHRNRAVHLLCLFSILLVVQKCSSYEFKVGGSGDWSVPSDHSASYNQWAERSRFQVGDTLLFTYPADKDSVLQVTKDNFNNCNTKSPIASYSDGHTVFKINQSGPHYFISGVEANCKNNEKVVIVVLANRGSGNPSPPPPSGPSPPSGQTNPAPAPSQVADNPPPPPPPKNGASSYAISSICFVGASVGSALLLF